MRRALVGLFAAALLLSLAVADALACGDKFLVIGRGLRNRIMKSEHPASIVLYMRPGSNVPGAAREMKLRSSLAQAGHRVQEVEDAEHLAAALRNGTDLVLADIGDADAVVERAQDSPARPTVLPLVPKRGDGLKTALACFPYTVAVPSQPGSYLKLVDAAMKTRLGPR